MSGYRDKHGRLIPEDEDVVFNPDVDKSYSPQFLEFKKRLMQHAAEVRDRARAPREKRSP